jgi:hypothetical protein
VLRALIGIAVVFLVSACGTEKPGDSGAGLRFLPTAGWNSTSAVGPGCPAGAAIAATESVSEDAADFPADTIKTLAPDATLVWACGNTGDGWGSSNFPQATLPLKLADARVDESWEGQPNRDVPQYLLWRRVDAYALDVRVFFGSQHPSAERLAAAQAELDQLRLPVP